MSYISSAKASKLLGLHPNTLRKYADEGFIKIIKTKGNQRRYDIDSYIKSTGNSNTICYCRVSSNKQKDDLERQCNRLSILFPNSEVIKDIGSGLNFKRKGLLTLLDRLMSGEKLKIVVTNRDRLARFGQGLIEYLINKNGGEFLVLDKDMASSP